MKAQVFKAGEKRAPKQGDTWFDAARKPWKVMQILRWEMPKPDQFVAVFVAISGGAQ